jgi:lipopolysaccharide/colanic/teichoic acid biosynthesis glycosyltransferase
MAGSMKDSKGQPLANREKNFKTSVIILVAMIALSVISNIVYFVVLGATLSSTGGSGYSY